MPKCEQITCGTLRAPPNGWMRSANSTAVGSKASFGCFQGYKLLGSRDRECQDNGEWSGPPVRCVPLAMYTDWRSTSCLDPGTPDNGVLMGKSRFTIGKEVGFACNPWYWLRGNATIRCLASGHWSARPPLCPGKFYFDDERYVMEVLRDKFSKDIQFPQSQRNDHNKATDHASTQNSPNTPHYVYFLFDASNSIGERNFRHAIDLAKAITGKVTVSERGSRIGAIVFAKEAEEVIHLGECISTEEALHKLDSIKYKSGNGTSIRAAITRLKISIDNVWAALHGTRKTVHFSVFLFSDGKANIGGRVDKLRVKNKQVETYCIGIRGNKDIENLKNLASKPTDTHLFVLRNSDALQRLAQELTTGRIGGDLELGP
ncbi:complement C2-like [Haemaphysalis longicornis]